MEFLLKSLPVFLLALTNNALWVFYMTSTTEKRAGMAAVAAGFLAVGNSATVIYYVENHLLIIPAVLGAMVGTGFPIWVSNRSKK